MAHKQYIPPEILALMEAGKKGQLWSLWVMYALRANNKTNLLKLQNLTADEVKKHRESMFRYGFTIHLEDNHWKIICPMDILDVDLFRQKVYIFEPSGSPNIGID